jgi:CubicO group peptidase (beta-lactamase class C family)
MMKQFGSVQRLLDQAVIDRVAPGFQCSVRWFESAVWHRVDLSAGRLTYQDDADFVNTDTCYDLASVTKALVALSVVSVAESLNVSLTDTVAQDYWLRSRDTFVGRCSLEQLLSHRAELAAWCPFFRQIDASNAGTQAAIDIVFEQLLAEPSEPNGHTVRYSDLGYIALGEVLAAMAGKPLDQVVHERVLKPLGLGEQMGFHHVRERRWANAANTAPTEHCAWRGGVVSGHVHDENAYALGGVCGHAGLFGTAKSLADLGQASLQILDGSRQTAWISQSAMRMMITPRAGGSHRLGWDGKSAGHSSAGTRSSAATFGHLGFTGTMLWCDPEAQVAVALVSNRVHPTRANEAIKSLRPRVMDQVFTLLGKGQV